MRKVGDGESIIGNVSEKAYKEHKDEYDHHEEGRACLCEHIAADFSVVGRNLVFFLELMNIHV